MEYPTIEQINAANREQLCRWWRFLPFANCDSQVDAINTLEIRFKEAGGFTPEISESIGWKE